MHIPIQQPHFVGAAEEGSIEQKKRRRGADFSNLTPRCLLLAGQNPCTKGQAALNLDSLRYPLNKSAHRLKTLTRLQAAFKIYWQLTDSNFREGPGP